MAEDKIMAGMPIMTEDKMITEDKAMPEERSWKIFDFSFFSKERDAIMGLAILWIMFFHSYHGGVRFFQNVPVLDSVGKFITYGNMGCEIFMIISGIGLYFSWRNRPEFRQFYLKRCKRIIIPLAIVWTPYWIWELAVGGVNLKSFILNITTLRLWVEGTQQIWFVSLVVVCYLLFPFIYKIIYCEEKGRFTRTAAMMIVSIMGIALLRSWFPSIYENGEIAFNRIPIFILGCYMGSLVYDNKRISAAWIIPALIITIAGFKILDMNIISGMERRLFYSIPAIGLVFILAFILGNWRIKLLDKLLSFFGKISLECYTTHILFITLYKHNRFYYPFAKGSVSAYLMLLFVAVLEAYFVGVLEKMVFKSAKAHG